MNFLEFVIQIDKILFYYINQVFPNSFFDAVLPFLRVASFWTPLYLFLILFVFMNMKKRQAFLWLLCFLLVVSFCDIVSSHIIKKMIYRMRPCCDPFWFGKVRHLTTYCSYSSSFTSSHACNHFGMAIFFNLSLKPYFKKYSFLFFLWAFLVSYAQIYVGVHYPLDIFFGGIIGLIIGYIGYQRYYVLISDNKRIAH